MKSSEDSLNAADAILLKNVYLFTSLFLILFWKTLSHIKPAMLMFWNNANNILNITNVMSTLTKYVIFECQFPFIQAGKDTL